MVRPGKGRGDALPEAFHRRAFAGECAKAPFVDRKAVVRKHRQRRAAAGDLGAIGALRPHAVAGEIDAGHAAAASIVHDWPELPGRRVEVEAAAGKVGKLGLRPQVMAEGDRVAIDPRHGTGSLADRDGGDALVRITMDLDRRDASMHGRAGQGMTENQPQSFGENVRAGRELRRGQHLVHQARRVEDRRDLGARLAVLAGDQLHERPGPHEHHASADRAALRLEGDLGRAEAVDAGVLPSLDRHDPVGGARGDDQGVEGKGCGRPVADHVKVAVSHVPGEMRGAIIDLGTEGVEGGMKRIGTGGLGAVEVA